MILLWLGLANWLVTLIITDSEIFRPVRERAQRWSYDRQMRDFTGPAPAPDAPSSVRTITIREGKLAYALRCALCTGVWVGIAESLYAHPLGWLTFLVVAAIGRVCLVAVALLDRLAQP